LFCQHPLRYHNIEIAVLLFREPSSVSVKLVTKEIQDSLEDTGVTRLSPIKVNIK